MGDKSPKNNDKKRKQQNYRRPRRKIKRPRSSLPFTTILVIRQQEPGQCVSRLLLSVSDAREDT